MNANFRFQGTDGVRRRVRLSKKSSGLTPQEVFIEKDIITEEFMELYTFCHVKWMIESGAAKTGERFVIGWDPRDPSGLFTDMAVRGIVKAGADALVVGTLPTPGVCVYMRSVKAAGAFMITASHNPPSYNGIKIFTRRCLKLLQGDDLILSEKIMDTNYDTVAGAPAAAEIIDVHEQAAKTFIAFSSNPVNSWINDPVDYKNFILIVDCANGAFSYIAKRALESAGLNNVICVNQKLDGSVNDNSGVAELEGFDLIDKTMIEKNGPLAHNEALKTLFRLGAENADAIWAGEKYISLAVFDGDGDRFFRVDYDPSQNRAFVLTGDQIACLQAELLKSKHGHKHFVNTVESDLCACVKAGESGYDLALTCVGDKWILLSAILLAVRPNMPSDLFDTICSLADSENPSAVEIEKILDENDVELAGISEMDMFIGSEESGHLITPGHVETSDGAMSTVLAGNGLKSCLNTLAATKPVNVEHYSRISGGARKIGMNTAATTTIFSDSTKSAVQNHIDKLQNAFTKGYKKTLYVYHVDKELWKRDSQIWTKVKQSLTEAIERLFPHAQSEEAPRAQETDMLYIRIIESGAHFASIFIRNSGTEDKTGITLRSPMAVGEKLLAAGVTAQKILLLKMKNQSKTMAKAERELIAQTAENGVPEAPVCGLDEKTYNRLLSESGVKQGIISGAFHGAALTDLGRWYRSKI